jgi:micrococcal nuclease
MPTDRSDTVVDRRAVRALLSVLLLAPSPLAFAACTPGPGARTAPLPDGGRGREAEVAEVIDGDTVDLTIGGATERARLLGIDTPETVHPDRPVECFGPEASARTKELLPAGTVVLLQRDEEARDRFGRLLVYLWRRDDGLFVNGTLVAEGYADTLRIEPNTALASDLSARRAAARAAGLGRWSSCPAEG